MIASLAHQAEHWTPKGVPHVYALTDPDLLANQAFFNLAARHRHILTDHFAHLVAPVPQQWLHATVQLVIDPNAPALSPRRLDEVAAALHHHVAGRPAFTLWAAPYVGTHNPALDLTPDEPFNQVVDLTGHALDQVLGQERSTYQPTSAHITTGYCHTSADSGPVANALRASRPSQAPVTITRLALVMGTHDPEGPSYRWHNPPVTTIDLPQERLTRA